MDYPIRYFNTSIATNKCNLRCHYCYVGQCSGYNNECFERELEYSFDHMKKCLSKTRLGGACMFNLCAAGETTLYTRLPEIIQMLLELGHYVSVVTNLTLSKPLKRIIEVADVYKSRLFIKCSFHYLELKKQELLDKFFENINFLKSSGVSFTVEMTVNDECVPHIEEIKKLCLSRLGALPHVIESRNETDKNFPRLTKLPLSEHQSVWGGFKSPLFDYQQKNYEKKAHGFCRAGDIVICFDIASGSVTQCEGTKHLANLYDDPDRKYTFFSIGANCPLPHCFASYYKSVLCGCFPEETPTYTDERDRVLYGGGHWLTFIMRSVFSHKMNEHHTPYSSDKMLFVDTYMRWIYSGQTPTDDEKIKLEEVFNKTLGSRKIGLVLAPPYLKKLLNPFILFSIDGEIEDKIVNGSLPEADMVIICDYENYGKYVGYFPGQDVLNILEFVP